MFTITVSELRIRSDMGGEPILGAHFLGRTDAWRHILEPAPQRGALAALARDEPATGIQPLLIADPQAEIRDY
jgi:hypothetical protein